MSPVRWRRDIPAIRRLWEGGLAVIGLAAMITITTKMIHVVFFIDPILSESFCLDYVLESINRWSWKDNVITKRKLRGIWGQEGREKNRSCAHPVTETVERRLRKISSAIEGDRRAPCFAGGGRLLCARTYASARCGAGRYCLIFSRLLFLSSSPLTLVKRKTHTMFVA